MNEAEVYERLKTVIDPELNVNIVDLGLVYGVEVKQEHNRTKIHIVMTLTTPGCPLAGVFNFIVRDAFRDCEDLNPETDVTIELTFDPPWTQEMMSDELKAKFGLDDWY